MLDLKQNKLLVLNSLGKHNAPHLNEQRRREIIRILIEDSIVNSKLINTLDSIGIDASVYSTSAVTIIYDLLGLDTKISKDDFYALFFSLIKEGESIEISTSRTIVSRFAEKVMFDIYQQFDLF
jgi:hypothetical protein